MTVLLRWAPLIFQGFLFNILISFLSMALGTLVGLLIGIAQVSLVAAVRKTRLGADAVLPQRALAGAAVLRDVPAALRVPPLRPHHRLPGLGQGDHRAGAAGRGQCLGDRARRHPLDPFGQWESAEALAFTRRQTMWMIILPQAFKRMIPPWMNLYAILTMATTLISVVGIQDGLTITRAALVAESRPELMIPMYLLLLLMFFAYCYPIARATLALERRFNVKA